jgi:hypothetical protein
MVTVTTSRQTVRSEIPSNPDTATDRSEPPTP